MLRRTTRLAFVLCFTCTVNSWFCRAIAEETAFDGETIASESAADALPRLRIDSGDLSLTFAAKSLRFENSEAVRHAMKTSQRMPLRCLLEGQARFAIAEDDVVITADRLEIESDGQEPTRIVGLGNCRYADGEGDGTKFSGDKMVLDFAADHRLTIEGNVEFHLESGTMVQTDTIIGMRDGSFEARGRVTTFHP